MIGAALGAIGSIAGGLINNMGAKAAADEAYENQKNIIQHQTSWLVKDAKRNGIHPLAVLGVNPASGPPPAQVFDSGIGEAASALGSAVERKMDPLQQLQIRAQQAAIEQSMAETDLTRTQIASQRMRNVQQSTPGVRSTNGNDVQVMTNPLTGEPFNVLDKDIGQKWENYGGEPGGFIGGLGGMAGDALRGIGIDPKEGLSNGNIGKFLYKLVQPDVEAAQRAYVAAQKAMGAGTPRDQLPWYQRMWYY